MTRLSTTAAVIASFLFASNAWAINIGFVPGDAFFHARLTYKWLHSDDVQPLSYVVPETAEFSACGYGGYWSLVFKGDSSELRANLKAVYEQMNGVGCPDVKVSFTNDAKRREWESDAPSIFIYNREYSASNGIGFRFNENWWQELPHRPVMKNGFFDAGEWVPVPKGMLSRPDPQGIYWPFRTSWRAVARDWKYADQIPGLTFTPPDVEGLSGTKIDEPITVDFKDIRVVVLQPGTLQRWDEPRDRNAGQFDRSGEPWAEDWWFDVTVDGITSRRETGFGEQTINDLPDQELAQEWLDLNVERWVIDKRWDFDEDYDSTDDLADVKARLRANEQASGHLEASLEESDGP